MIITTAALANQFPSGQALEAGGELAEYYVSDYGMYAILDNSVYLDKAQRARRGVLFTNDRSTVVIQDEIEFKGAQACAWVAQTAAESIIISEDGKTAVLTQTIDGVTLFLRATIVEPGGALKFEKMSTVGKNLLASTNAANYSTSNKGAPEYDRTGRQRLVIRQSEQSIFSCAVVFEVVNTANSRDLVKYEYKEMNLWDESMVTETFVPTTKNENLLTSPSVNDISKYTEEATGYIPSGSAFSMKLEAFYKAMVRVAGAVKFFKPTGALNEDSKNAVPDAIDAMPNYEKNLESYALFREDVNYYMTVAQTIGTYITGFN